MKTLVVGGTSGLGLALAKALVQKGYDVFVAGRREVRESGITQLHFDVGLDAEAVFNDTAGIVEAVGDVDLLIYSAGAFEDGLIDNLEFPHIVQTMNVGFLAPALLFRRILAVQGKLPGAILVTSTSQWTPRLREPVYAAAKAGLAMLGQSIAIDPRVGKVLVAAPAGMDTPFWKGGERKGKLLDPAWVAGEILQWYSEGEFKYRLVGIFRDPPNSRIMKLPL